MPAQITGMVARAATLRVTERSGWRPPPPAVGTTLVVSGRGLAFPESSRNVRRSRRPHRSGQRRPFRRRRVVAPLRVEWWERDSRSPTAAAEHTHVELGRCDPAVPRLVVRVNMPTVR